MLRYSFLDCTNKMFSFILVLLSVCFPNDNLPLRIRIRRFMAASDQKKGHEATAHMHIALSNYYVQNGPKLIGPSNDTVTADDIEKILKKHLEEYFRNQREDESDI